MKRVTRNIAPEAARDLLERAPRACISFATDIGPQIQPVVLLWSDGCCLAGIHENALDRQESGQAVVLLVDDGVHYFELRAIFVRCHVRSATAPEGAPGRHVWFEVDPLKTVAWDYGILREAEDEV